MGAMHRGHTKCDGWRADCRGDDLEGLGKTVGFVRSFGRILSASPGISVIWRRRARPAR